jgi:hypothetical protein
VGDAVPHSHELPLGDHGHDSVAHFALATLAGPPPPILPAPSVARAPAPDSPVHDDDAPALPQPPARGPPA